MWALRPLLRRGVTYTATRSPCFRSLQYGSQPHKEYFQNNPGQAPLPDYAVTYHQPPLPAAFQPQQPSYFRRGLSSIIWSSLFGGLGFAAGTGLITWEYHNSPIDLDEEEEEGFLQDILEELRSHPLVQMLIEDKWHLQEVYPRRSRAEMQEGFELLYEKLMGTRGITIVGNGKTVIAPSILIHDIQHEFCHPTSRYTMLVFYLTDGLEAWPDTV